jgi:hypothetical protein
MFSAQGAAGAKSGLEVLAEDEISVVQILDEGYEVLKSGVGEVRGEFDPGFYRARLVAADGSNLDRLIWLEPGREWKTVSFPTPLITEALSGAIRETAATTQTIQSLPTHIVENLPTVYIPGEVTPSSWPVRLISGVIEGVVREFSRGYWRLILRPPPAPTGLRILVPPGIDPADVRFRAWPQSFLRPVSWKASPKTRGNALTHGPGPYWVEFKSAILRANYIVSTAILPEWETTVMLLPSSGHSHVLYQVMVRRNAPHAATAWGLKQTMAQLACSAGRFDLALKYVRTLKEAFEKEPLAVCLAGFLMLKMGLARDDDFQVAARTAREKFPALSDAHVLWAEYKALDGRSEGVISPEADHAYRDAAEIGAPIFREAFARLASAAARILGVPERDRLVTRDDAPLRRILELRETAVARGLFTVVREV